MRYVSLHDDRIPYPVKERTFAIEDDTIYDYACTRLSETLLTIDECIAEPDGAAKRWYGED